MVFAVAASILVVVGLASWAVLRQHNQQIISAVVDLRDRSMARGTEPPPTEPPLEIPRNVSHLKIYLPLGASDGFYEIRITSSGATEVLYSGTGEAKMEQGVTLLNVEVDRRLSRRGSYLLQMRRPSAEWLSFPLQIR